jgi:mannose-6-phosphate isomerase-like protein (cupin superfamily)
MDQLDRGLRQSIAGPIRARALKRFGELLKEWGLRMPSVEPLVLDFGMGDFQRIGLIEYWIANEEAAGYCGKFLFVLDGQTCPLHYHRNKLETFFIVRGEVEMEYQGAVWTMSAGDTLRVECGKAHRFTGLGPALLLEVSLPSIIDDNYFVDARIPFGRKADRLPQ